MRLSIWRYELTRLGWPALAGAPLALAALGLLTILAQTLGNPRQVNNILSECLDVLPVVAGIAAGIVGAVGLDGARGSVSGGDGISSSSTRATPSRIADRSRAS